MATVIQFPQSPRVGAAARGVYYADALTNGARILYAVTHRGDEVGRTCVPDGIDETLVVSALYDFLDAVDPPAPDGRR